MIRCDLAAAAGAARRSHGAESEAYYAEMWNRLADGLVDNIGRGSYLTAAVWLGAYKRAYQRAGRPALVPVSPARRRGPTGPAEGR